MNSKTVYGISAIIFVLGVLLGVFATYTYLTIKPESSIPDIGGIACTMEAKICPDGTAVGRIGPNCEFASCGMENVENIRNEEIEPIDSVGGGGGTATIVPGDSGPVACTMDAKACPDGSYVGRVGPNCEFEECPNVVTSDNSCKTNSDCKSGYECIDTSPVIREGQPANLHCWKIGTPTPICLSGETKIATPDGDVLVKNMKVGMSIWTTNGSGKKISGTVILAGKTKVPNDHKVMHIKLSDGRELFVSPGHKIADGRNAGKIILGDVIDDTVVVLADLVSYQEEYTYDILPSGNTGRYFANGILLQSTLK